MLIVLIMPVTVIAVPLGMPVENGFIPSQFTLQTFERNMNVTTFVTPDNSMDAIFHFLDSAQESIYVEIYQFNSPAFLDKMHELFAANPSLDIKVLISEGVVSLGDYNIHTAWNLTQLGIPVRWTSNTFTYSHQKFIIIDNKTTIVQSGNWAKNSFPRDEWTPGSSPGGFTQKNYRGNREWQIAMTDIEVTGYYRDVFDYDWSIGTDYNESTDGTGTPLTWLPIETSYYPRPFSEEGTFSGTMKVTPVFSPDTSLEGILWCINSAQATLDIQIPYMNNGSASVRSIIDAIIAAKHRGVTVRIITDEGEGNNEELAEDLAKENIPVLWMDTRFFYLNHNKAIIVDGRMVLICSINWSGTSIDNNREAGVIIQHEGVAAWYLQVYNYDWGIADCDATGQVNVGWNPYIPSSASQINVTVYAQMLYPDVEDVKLGVKIDDGAWSNHTITSNVYESSEGVDENYFYVLSHQSDGTNITVQAFVQAASVWYRGIQLVIPVRDDLGITTPTTQPTTPPTTPPPPPYGIVELLAEYGIYIIAAVAVVVLAAVFKKR
jgi:phosphatidylserine/phosphatidylglycerophosphate/cardiolipin synthase-like enzyme